MQRVGLSQGAQPDDVDEAHSNNLNCITFTLKCTTAQLQNRHRWQNVCYTTGAGGEKQWGL